MTLIDGSSGSAPEAMCGLPSRNYPVCPAPASAATGAPSHIYLGSVDRRMSGSEAGLRPATSISGGVQGLFAGAELKSASHCIRKIGNPRVEKVLQRRSQMIFV